MVVNYFLPTPMRGGVFPYTIINGECFILVGIDKVSGDITDFGGGTKLAEYETFPECAARELAEETEGVLMYDARFISKCKYIRSRKIGIYFVPVYAGMQETYEAIQERLTDTSEMRTTKWLAWKDFCNIAFSDTPHSHTIYFRIKKLLVNNIKIVAEIFLQQLIRQFNDMFFMWFKSPSTVSAIFSCELKTCRTPSVYQSLTVTI